MSFLMWKKLPILGSSVGDGRWHVVLARKDGVKTKHYPRSAYCVKKKNVWHTDAGIKLPRAVTVTHIAFKPELPDD